MSESYLEHEKENTNPLTEFLKDNFSQVPVMNLNMKAEQLLAYTKFIAMDRMSTNSFDSAITVFVPRALINDFKSESESFYFGRDIASVNLSDIKNYIDTLQRRGDEALIVKLENYAQCVRDYNNLERGSAIENTEDYDEDEDEDPQTGTYTYSITQ